MDQGSTYAEAASPLQARLAAAFGEHDVSFNDKAEFRAAMDTVPEDQLDDLTWEKLPEAARAVIERCEALPLTTWEDPLDVPDDTSYMD